MVAFFFGFTSATLSVCTLLSGVVWASSAWLCICLELKLWLFHLHSTNPLSSRDQHEQQAHKAPYREPEHVPGRLEGCRLRNIDHRSSQQQQCHAKQIVLSFHSITQSHGSSHLDCRWDVEGDPCDIGGHCSALDPARQRHVSVVCNTSSQKNQLIVWLCAWMIDPTIPWQM